MKASRLLAGLGLLLIAFVGTGASYATSRFELPIGQKCHGHHCTTTTKTTTTTATTTPTTTTTTTPTTTAATTTIPTDPAWMNVLDDEFNSGGVPSHWQLYHSPYGSAPQNCTSPTHDFVSGGYLHIVESHELATPAGVSCPYGAGWYTGGMKLDPVAPYVGDDQRITVRYRIVSTGGIVSHHIIPMRWPTATTYVYRKNNGESDFLESDSDTTEHVFLHYVDSSGNGQQIASPLLNVDLTQWHTVRAVKKGQTVSLYVDNMTMPLWTVTGTTTSIPDVIRTTVLQQECNHSAGCPTGTSGSEDIEIDWITVDNAN